MACVGATIPMFGCCGQIILCPTWIDVFFTRTRDFPGFLDSNALQEPIAAFANEVYEELRDAPWPDVATLPTARNAGYRGAREPGPDFIPQGSCPGLGSSILGFYRFSNFPEPHVTVLFKAFKALMLLDAGSVCAATRECSIYEKQPGFSGPVFTYPKLSDGVTESFIDGWREFVVPYGPKIFTGSSDNLCSAYGASIEALITKTELVFTYGPCNPAP